MTNEPYTTVVSGITPQENEFCTISSSLGYKTVVPDRCIDGPLFEALLWDYFCQHFYEWVRL